MRSVFLIGVAFSLMTGATASTVAVLGRLEPETGRIRAELHLFEVESGQELRSYFVTGADARPIARLGDAAAVRIAALLREEKGRHRAR